jgi:hypothetical protein
MGGEVYARDLGNTWIVRIATFVVTATENAVSASLAVMDDHLPSSHNGKIREASWTRTFLDLTILLYVCILDPSLRLAATTYSNLTWIARQQQFQFFKLSGCFEMVRI